MPLKLRAARAGGSVSKMVERAVQVVDIAAWEGWFYFSMGLVTSRHKGLCWGCRRGLLRWSFLFLFAVFDVKQMSLADKEARRDACRR